MKKTKTLVVLAGLVAAGGLMTWKKVSASDHADTPQIAASPGTDLTDVYIFPSPSDSSKVVLVMNVNPLITPSTKNSTFFDPNVTYQFKIDHNLDGNEDRVIQVWFEGTGAGQKVHVAGPLQPSSVGTTAVRERDFGITGTLNTPFEPLSGMKVFAGPREDSFFFDLEQFFTILPDRATPITGVAVADPNTPKDTKWRPVGTAVDFLSNGNYSVLSIVIELPKTMVLN